MRKKLLEESPFFSTDHCRACHARGCGACRRAARADAAGLMVVPSTNLPNQRQGDGGCAALPSRRLADLPIMIYSNRVAYRVDVTTDVMEDLASDARFVAIKEFLGRHPA